MNTSTATLKPKSAASRKLAAFLRRAAHLLMLDNKIPRLLLWFARRLDPETPEAPVVTVRSRNYRG